jgi:long-chain fatty acid transport protein
MKSFASCAVLFTPVLLSSLAFADGGYYAGTLGARASGRGGAFTAKADDVSAISFNPAGLAKLDASLFQIGNEASYNAYAYTRAPTNDYRLTDAPVVVFDKVTSSTPWQSLLPMLGATSRLGLENWGFGLAAFAPPGMSKEEFPLGGGQRYMMLSREAIILTYAASAAWKYQDIFGVGATAEWIHVPRLNYSLVVDGTPFAKAANPVSAPLDILAETKGSSLFTFNAILGTWYRPVPFLELALSGQVVPANIKTKSTLSVTPLDTSAAPSVTLTRGGRAANDVSLTLPLPLVFRSGVRYRGLAGAREIFDVEFDVDYTTWSRVKNFTIDTNGLQAKISGFDPSDIDRIVIDKHWRDTFAFKLGGDYAVVPDRLTLRAGAYYETAVADPAYANVDFPGGPQLGGALGASLFFQQFEVALTYQLRVQPSVSVSESNARVYQQVPSSTCVAPYTDTDNCNAHFLGQPSPAINAGTYSASSHLLAINVLYRY